METLNDETSQNIPKAEANAKKPCPQRPPGASSPEKKRQNIASNRYRITLITLFAEKIYDPFTNRPANSMYPRSMTKMKIRNLLCLLIVALNCPLQADTVSVIKTGQDSRELSASLTDFVRQNLVHIFDSSQFHQMKGSTSAPKTQKQIEEQLKRVKSKSHIELDLDEPARIVVEGTDLHATRMWVSIRESDGFVYDWILQQPNGNLVSLAKPRGELVVQFAPSVLNLLKPDSEQVDGGNGG